MITDALWTDFNNDQKPDLMLAGEFTPLMFFQNGGETFSSVQTDIDGETGWWNSIAAADYDRDGDTDYVVGNLGLNNCYQVTKEFPLTVYADDFDSNGSMDAIMACYIRESMSSDERKLYPAHFWDELNNQSPKFRNKFSHYRQYGKATVNDVLDDSERADALVLEAGQMASAFVENTGDGKFRLRTLPVLAQVAPVNGVVSDDVNGDGFPDVVMVGNDYGNEVFAGRYDAFNGLVLLGDGKGNFEPKTSAFTGFYVPGDAKSLIRLHGVNNELFIASQNRDSLGIFRKTVSHTRHFQPEALDVRAELFFQDGTKQVVEFYYGSGYLSQSTRSISIPAEVHEIVVYDSNGESRKVLPGRDGV